MLSHSSLCRSRRDSVRARGRPAQRVRRAPGRRRQLRPDHSMRNIMRTHPLILLVLLVGAAAIATAKPDIAPPIKLALPGGDDGIGFDDLMYSPALHRVLAT